MVEAKVRQPRPRGQVRRAQILEAATAVFLERGYAGATIAKWVLGRYWRQLTPLDQAEYLKLFHDYIVASYVDRFAAYAGEKLLVTKVLAEEGDRITVFSEIQAPDSGKTPIHVDWRIEGTDLHFKIVDLVVEGVSMSTTFRADFGSIIRRDAGDVSGLFAILREKTATLSTTN